MLKRISAGILLLSLAVSSQAQLQSATGPAAKPLPAAPKAAYNSMSKSTTPFNCQKLAWPTGTACIGGQAFRKLPNGWEQIHAAGGGWQRCREH